MASIPESKAVAPESSSFAPGFKVHAGGRTSIDHFDAAPPFSSMLPGIGGTHGLPLWCFYVNRGQGVVSFGARDKDGAIAEFLPANWAYQLVALQGFRTLCRIDGAYYEPFASRIDLDRRQCSRVMHIEPHAISVAEVDRSRGLQTEVQYFSTVNQPVASLVRTLTIRNLTEKRMEVSVLDGLPLLVPAGCTDHALKHMRRLMEAYACVDVLDEGISLHRMKVRAHDEAEVKNVAEVNFFASWTVGAELMQPAHQIVDPFVIFDESRDLQVPRGFLGADDVTKAAQQRQNRLPCAFSAARQRLAAYESLQIVSIFGWAPQAEHVRQFCRSFRRIRDVHAARRAASDVVHSVSDPCLTISSHGELNAYCRQNVLDNVLRGGIPVSLPSRQGRTQVHVYARRHGDLERDYNHFELPAESMSSGPGNYRDVCQNRRNDLWLYADAGIDELRMFASLLTPDGFNPLGVSGYRWQVPAGVELMIPESIDGARQELERIVHRPFQAGEVLQWLMDSCHGVAYRSRWLERILGQCDRVLMASGHEGGFWIDHWTYLADLLESYARLHPHDTYDVLTNGECIEWFDDGAFVAPRSEKYARCAAHVQQVDAVRDVDRRTQPLPPVTLFGKLAALVAIKSVSFDVECRGIEMEAGRPGWNDALNGLPAQFGSSTCETAELARLSRLLLDYASPVADTRFPEVVCQLIEQVVDDLESDAYDWDWSCTIRETYRERVRREDTPGSRVLPSALLERLLKGAERRSLDALNRSVDPKSGLMHTYFIRMPRADVEADSGEAAPSEIVEHQYAATPLPLYLEGQVHWLRVLEDRAQARRVWEGVRSGPLFDNELQMYKLNESLQSCHERIGRARTFTPGWFENESIWLHMSYKYLLELLRHGLYTEFFQDARTMLVPFLDPHTYGRTVLENSSFIVSSVHPDPALHGRGFVGRLSGSTSEFIDIWLHLTLGLDPFRHGDGKLLQLSPILPADWFITEPISVVWRGKERGVPENSFACALLGATLLVYHNPARRNTFGPDGAAAVRYEFDSRIRHEGPTLSESLTNDVRQRRFDRIDVHLE